MPVLPWGDLMHAVPSQAIPIGPFPLLAVRNAWWSIFDPPIWLRMDLCLKPLPSPLAIHVLDRS